MSERLTESAIQAGILDCARKLGFLALHITEARRSEPGFPDILIVGFGTILAFEAKSQRGKLRAASLTKRGRYLPGQADWLDALRDAGVIAYVVRPEAAYGSVSYDNALSIIQAVVDAQRAA